MPAAITVGGLTERPVDGLPSWRDLDTPSEVTFTVINETWYSRDIPGGHTEKGFYALASEVVGPAFGLPYSPNPRKPIKCRPGTAIEKSASNVADALVPSSNFVLANNGIDIVGTAEHDDLTDIVTITFQDGEGIINGGLTYYTISRLAGLHEDTIVSFRIWSYNDLGVGDKSAIAFARNSHREISSADLANQNGLLISLKDGLGDYSNRINWSTGDVDYNEWLAAEEGGASLSSQNYIKILKAMVCEEGQWHPSIRSAGVPDPYASHAAGKILTGGKACLEEYVKGFGDEMAEYSIDDDALLLQAAFSKEIMRLRDMLLYYMHRLDEAHQWRPVGDGLVFIDGCEPFKALRPKGDYDFFTDHVHEKSTKTSIMVPPANLPADQEDGVGQPEMKIKNINVNLVNCLVYGFKSNIHIQPDPDAADHTQIGWLVNLDQLMPETIPHILTALDDVYRAQDRDATKAFQMRGVNNQVLGKMAVIIGNIVILHMQTHDVHAHLFTLHNAESVEQP